MKKIIISLSVLGLSSIALFTQSCKKNETTVTPTLYDTLGGTSKVADPANSGMTIEKGRLAIRSVVDSAIFVIAADAEINKYFSVLLSEVTSGNTTGLEALSKNLTDFVCVATGAKDFTYGGKSMVAAHNPATNSRMNGKADNGDFDAFEADLVTGAHQNGVPDAIIARLGAIVETLRSQVVQM